MSLELPKPTPSGRIFGVPYSLLSELVAVAKAFRGLRVEGADFVSAGETAALTVREQNAGEDSGGELFAFPGEIVTPAVRTYVICLRAPARLLITDTFAKMSAGTCDVRVIAGASGTVSAGRVSDTGGLPIAGPVIVDSGDSITLVVDSVSEEIEGEPGSENASGLSFVISGRVIT